jgi:hypothetical protein
MPSDGKAPCSKQRIESFLIVMIWYPPIFGRIRVVFDADADLHWFTPWRRKIGASDVDAVCYSQDGGVFSRLGLRRAPGETSISLQAAESQALN